METSEPALTVQTHRVLQKKSFQSAGLPPGYLSAHRELAIERLEWLRTLTRVAFDLRVPNSGDGPAGYE